MSDTKADVQPDPQTTEQASSNPDSSVAAAPTDSSSPEPTQTTAEKAADTAEKAADTAQAAAAQEKPKRSLEELEQRLQELSAENKSYRQRYGTEKEARTALEQEYASERAQLMKQLEEREKAIGTLNREKVLAKYEDRLSPDDRKVLDGISDPAVLAAAAARFASAMAPQHTGPFVPSEGSAVSAPTNDMQKLRSQLFGNSSR